MPLPKFDNLNDVSSKFANTVCYYKNKPVFVTTAFHDDYDKKKFLLSVHELNSGGQIVDVHDPDFRYTGYNIGYANHVACTWWYRRPAKQYQQGLKAEQLRYYSEDNLGGPKDVFNFNKRYVDMLSNIYPSLEEAKKSVRDGKSVMKAWHRDFAVSWDEHDNYYPLYYRANRIGTILPVAGPQLIPNANYVKEALQEAMS